VRIGRPEDALPLLELDPTDVSAVQDVIQRMTLDSADLHGACTYLVDVGRFRASQYGISELATNGRLPDDFVPGVWRRASDEERRIDLLRFAEEQLGARSNEALHRFVLNVVFAASGTVSAEVRGAAWWCLLRWYGRTEYASKGPLAFDAAVIDRFFTGGVATFVERLLVVLHDPETTDHLELEECIGNLLRYSPEPGLPSVTAVGDAFGRLVEGLLVVLGDSDRRLTLRCDMVRFLENNVRADPTMAPRVLALLAPFERDELEFEISTTMQRIRGD
jgi:hypothetical protein